MVSVTELGAPKRLVPVNYHLILSMLILIASLAATDRCLFGLGSEIPKRTRLMRCAVNSGRPSQLYSTATEQSVAGEHEALPANNVQAQESKMPKVFVIDRDQGELDEEDGAELDLGDSTSIKRRSRSGYGRSGRVARQVAAPNLAVLIEDLARAINNNQAARQPGGTVEQVLDATGRLAGTIIRQASSDVPVMLGNVARFMVSLVGLLTVNNPIIANSPTLGRLRNSSNTSANSSDERILADILRLLRSNRTTVRPQQVPDGSTKSPEPLAEDLGGPDSEREARFVRRLNELTWLETRNRRRSKRSIGSMLMMGPFSKFYMAMWFHKLVRQQSNLLTQVVVGELLRRFVLPAAMAPFGKAPQPGPERVQADRERLGFDPRDCTPVDESLPVGRPWLRPVTGGPVDQPLISVDQRGVSVQLPGETSGQLSISHLRPELQGLLYRSLERAPVVLQTSSQPRAEQMGELARQMSSVELMKLLELAGSQQTSTKVESRPRPTLSAEEARSLVDMIARVAGQPGQSGSNNSSSSSSGGNNSGKPSMAKSRKPDEEVAAEVGELARQLEAIKLALLTGAEQRANVSARAAGTTNVVNLRVQQVAGDQVLAGRRPGSNKAGATPLPRARANASLVASAAPSNHRMGQTQTSESVRLGQRAPEPAKSVYLFQPLDTSRKQERDDAARWNDILAHLADNQTFVGRP